MGNKTTEHQFFMNVPVTPEGGLSLKNGFLDWPLCRNESKVSYESFGQ
ncbi:hypothetical protein [Oceanobacillus kimchii]|nr:hypothetical protein [Oceanobacillus kimchii]